MSKNVCATQIVGVGGFRFCTLLHCTTKREVRRNCGVRLCISRHPCGNSASFPPQGTSTRAKPRQRKLITRNSRRDFRGTFHLQAKQKLKYSNEECETAAVASLAPSLVAALLVARMLGTIAEPWQASKRHMFLSAVLRPFFSLAVSAASPILVLCPSHGASGSRAWPSLRRR